MGKEKRKDTNKVKKLREQKAWTKTELAKAAGLSHKTISSMENFIKTSRNSKLKVAKALEVDIEELFENTN